MYYGKLGVQQASYFFVEFAAVISASEFAKSSASFWRNVAPTSESFVRRINSELYKREFAPSQSGANALIIGYINEIALDAFCIAVKNGKGRSDCIDWRLSEELFKASSSQAWSRLRKYSRTSAEKPLITDRDRSDIATQFERLIVFFRTDIEIDNIRPRPRFAGCGIIDESEGDVETSHCLYEIKAGRRLFRSADIHQLLMYTSLRLQETGKMIPKLGLFNPRLGFSFVGDLETICFEISGQSARDLLYQIVEATSAGSISR